MLNNPKTKTLHKNVNAECICMVTVVAVLYFVVKRYYPNTRIYKYDYITFGNSNKLNCNETFQQKLLIEMILFNLCAMKVNNLENAKFSLI